MSDPFEDEKRGASLGVHAAYEAAAKVIRSGEFDYNDILDAISALGAQPPDTRWLPISTAPQDGTSVLVSDGERVWISSQTLGKYVIKSKDKMPVNGHQFYMLPNAKLPIKWMRIPTP